MFTNDYKGKKELVKALSEVYKNIDSDIASIELKKYRNISSEDEEEFILLTWTNGAISTANNNMNSLSATARNVVRMLDGGVYENLSYYKEIMKNEKWWEVKYKNEGYSFPTNSIYETFVKRVLERLESED